LKDDLLSVRREISLSVFAATRKLANVADMPFFRMGLQTAAAAAAALGEKERGARCDQE
jgi:hypothetical protein